MGMDADTQALVDRLLARIAELEAENQDLRQRLEASERRNQELQQNLAALQQRLEEVERGNARQAAPFRRREEKKVPPGEKKRPGRPMGHPGVQRAIPEHIDEEVDVPLEACPKCGGGVSDVKPIERYILEVVPAHVVATKVTTYQTECPECQTLVYSSHPLQTAPGPWGSKVQLGPRALAAATQLNKQHGLTMRKTCTVLRDLCGLKFSPGGLAQAVQRVAAKLEPEYEDLLAKLRTSKVVFVDETSWWVNGPKWWLWTFTNDQVTIYIVDRSRASQVVLERLGADFKGMLVSDCLAIYDSLPYRKHKCIAHHLQAIKKAKQRPDTPDHSYLNQWEIFFLIVRLNWKYGPRTPNENESLRKHRDELLARELVQPGDIAVRSRLTKQRDHLLGCLDDHAAEPTNNRAERALRPAVIARKLSCGNKTERGKRAWEILASLTTTWTQHGKDVITELTTRLTTPPARAPSATPAG